MDSSRELNAAEQKIALDIARRTLAASFSDGAYSLSADLPAIFKEKRGAFVTLRDNEQLRGCIGIFEGRENLAETIKEMAMAAAFDDSRFPPLTADELEKIKIEISVLSPMQRVASADEIELGKHGVYVSRDWQNGVYLPQVAEETGWGKEKFLDSLCEEKAGLPKNCWRDGTAELSVFTAQVFKE